MAVDLKSWRVPIGSLVVDASLVVALIWWGATMTERLDQLMRRIDQIDGQGSMVQADKRLSVVESRQGDVDRRLEELRQQNSRIEAKVDRLLER